MSLKSELFSVEPPEFVYYGDISSSSILKDIEINSYHSSLKSNQTETTSDRNVILDDSECSCIIL